MTSKESKKIPGYTLIPGYPPGTKKKVAYTPRKTMKEVRLEERTNGFYKCLHELENYWRDLIGNDPRGWYAAAKVLSPEQERIWKLIEKCQEMIRTDNNEYKDLFIGRLEQQRANHSKTR